MNNNALNIFVSISIALGLVLLSWGIVTICYTPTEKEIVYIMERR